MLLLRRPNQFNQTPRDARPGGPAAFAPATPPYRDMARQQLLLVLSIGCVLASPPFNASTINHFCLVTRDFNSTARAYAWLFGGVPPVGKISEHSWLWYRGENTSALAMLVHAPGGPAGFSVEIISPLDDKPSIYNELLSRQGNSVQHIGLNVDPPGSIDAARAAFAARGYEAVFAGQGSWGCFIYFWMREDFGTLIEVLDPGNMNCSAPS